MIMTITAASPRRRCVTVERRGNASGDAVVSDSHRGVIAGSQRRRRGVAVTFPWRRHPSAMSTSSVVHFSPEQSSPVQSSPI